MSILSSNSDNAKIAEIIKYEGDNTTFVWKHPCEDFYTGSQLIVHESQEAVFFLNGQAYDIFGAGRHTLETQNLPLVGRLFSAPAGGRTPFHCEVYFVNKTEQLAAKWGTDSKLEYIDPMYDFPIKIGASGEMALTVLDSAKLLIKVVGTERSLTQQGFILKMRAFMLTRIKNYLASYIKEKKINIFEIDEHLVQISDALMTLLKPDFEDYGVELRRFFVTAVVKPEEDASYRRFRELHYRRHLDVAEAKLRQETGLIDQDTQRRRMILEAEGIAAKRALEGYTYQEERGFDVAERVAGNEAVGQMTNMGVGLGMMAGVGGAVGSTVGGMVNNTMGQVFNTAAPPQAVLACANCGKELPQNAKFCLECGTPTIRKCPACGTQIPPGGKFCLECGHKI